jgi:hypothetical protein
MLEKIKKYTGILILILVVIIILVIYQITGTKNTMSPSPSPSSTASTITEDQQAIQTSPVYPIPAYSQPPTDTTGQVDVKSPKVQSAVTTKSKLEDQLPIYIENFQTSVGGKTTLNVYTIPEDPDYLIHIEIYGINYEDTTIIQPGNKQGQMFIDSFNKIKSLLLAKGVDIHNIYFVFGARPYIQKAADDLIQKYKLL